MLRKLTVLLMAILFSFSVAGVSFAQEKKPGATPATPATPPTPAKKEGAVNPCGAAGEKEMGKKKKKAKKKAAKKKAMDEEKKGATPATPATPAPEKK